MILFELRRYSTYLYWLFMNFIDNLIYIFSSSNLLIGLKEKIFILFRFWNFSLWIRSPREMAWHISSLYHWIILDWSCPWMFLSWAILFHNRVVESIFILELFPIRKQFHKFHISISVELLHFKQILKHFPFFHLRSAFLLLYSKHRINLILFWTHTVSNHTHPKFKILWFYVLESR